MVHNSVYDWIMNPASPPLTWVRVAIWMDNEPSLPSAGLSESGYMNGQWTQPPLRWPQWEWLYEWTMNPASPPMTWVRVAVWMDNEPNLPSADLSENGYMNGQWTQPPLRWPEWEWLYEWTMNPTSPPLTWVRVVILMDNEPSLPSTGLSESGYMNGQWTQPPLRWPEWEWLYEWTMNPTSPPLASVRVAIWMDNEPSLPSAGLSESGYMNGQWTQPPLRWPQWEWLYEWTMIPASPPLASVRVAIWMDNEPSLPSAGLSESGYMNGQWTQPPLRWPQWEWLYEWTMNPASPPLTSVRVAIRLASYLCLCLLPGYCQLWDDILTPYILTPGSIYRKIFWPRGQYIVTIFLPPSWYFDPPPNSI